MTYPDSKPQIAFAIVNKNMAGNCAMNDQQEKLDRLAARLQRLSKLTDLNCCYEELDDLSAEQVDKLSPEEAASYLTSVNNEKVLAAYHVLENRIEEQRLATICLNLIERNNKTARMAGIHGIGSSLKGSNDLEASTSLATLIRNENEDLELRWLAFLSLLLINKESWKQFKDKNSKPLDRDQKVIDWDFVDSFLARGD